MMNGKADILLHVLNWECLISGTIMFIARRNGLRNAGLHNVHHSLPCSTISTPKTSIIFNLWQRY